MSEQKEKFIEMILIEFGWIVCFVTHAAGLSPSTFVGVILISITSILKYCYDSRFSRLSGISTKRLVVITNNV